MKTLLVSKISNLELYGDAIGRRVAKRVISKHHMDMLTSAHNDHYKTLDVLRETLESHGVKHISVARGLYWPDIKGVDFIITVGGDGTVLAASHNLEGADIPIIGVCSSGTSIGYLCASDCDNIDILVKNIVSNKLPVVTLSRLQATVHQTQSSGKITSNPVLNDFLFSNVSPAATTRYQIEIGDIKEEHKSSGVWVSTAAGSTAAIGAAGGQQIPLEKDLFQYFVRELYSSTSRDASSQIRTGLFDPDKNPLTITNLCDEAILAVDGQHGKINLSYGDKIFFSKASPLRLARPRSLMKK